MSSMECVVCGLPQDRATRSASNVQIATTLVEMLPSLPRKPSARGLNAGSNTAAHSDVQSKMGGGLRLLPKNRTRISSGWTMSRRDPQASARASILLLQSRPMHSRCSASVGWLTFGEHRNCFQGCVAQPRTQVAEVRGDEHGSHTFRHVGYYSQWR